MEFKTQDVILPIPAIKIKDIVAEIRDLTFDIIPDKIIVQGIIHKQIFFVGTDNLVHHQSDDMPFSTFLDVPGAEPGMLAQINVIIEKVIAHIIEDGTVIRQKVVLEIFAKIEEELVTRIALSMEPYFTGPLVELNLFVGEANRQISLENEVTLNQPAEKIDEITAVIRDLQVEVIEDKVIIQGIVHKQIFFVNEAGLGVHQAEDIPFSTFIDLPGAEPGMDARVNAVVEFISFNLSPDGITLEQNIIININVILSEVVQENIAIGADLLAKLPVVIGENTTQVIKVNNFTLDQPAEKIQEITARVENIRIDIIDNKVIVQGIIHKQIFYVGLDGIVYHQAENIPFSTFLDIPGSSPEHFARVEANIEDVIFNLLDASTLHQKVLVEIFVKVEEFNQLNVVVVDDGIEVILPVVVAENNKQILVEQRPPVPVPPVAGLEVEFITIVEREAVRACEQGILDDTINLDTTAIKIRDVIASIENVTVQAVTEDLVIVSGVVNKTIIFVDTQDVIREQMIAIPFDIEVDLPTPVDVEDLTPEVVIENLSFELLPGGEQMREIVVLEACVQSDIIETQRVVTSVTGPGITTATIQVNAEVVVSENPLVTEEMIITVVTDILTDPENLISEVVKDTKVLDVVGEGPQLVEVVVLVE